MQQYATSNILPQIKKQLQKDKSEQLKALEILEQNKHNPLLIRCLREDDSFYKFIKQICLTELNDIQILLLEAVKFWATHHQYRIDLPNELKFFRDKTDEEILKEYTNIIYDHQNDELAINDILNQQLNEQVKSMLSNYIQPLEQRYEQISIILSQPNKILLKDQINKLIQIQQFIQQKVKQIKEQTKQKFKHYDKLQDKNKNIIQIKTIDEVVEVQKPVKAQGFSSLFTDLPNSSLYQSKPSKNSNTEVDLIKQAEKQFVNHFIQQFQNMSINVLHKQYFGIVVGEPQQLGFIINKKTKLSCLMNRSIIFNSHELQIGIVSHQFSEHNDTHTGLIIKFVIGNKKQQDMEFCRMFVNDPPGLQIWKENIELESIKSKKQQKFHVVVQYLAEIINPIQCQFSWIEGNQQFISDFILPCLLVKFIQQQQFQQTEFRWKWRRQKYSCYRTEAFPLDREIIKNPLYFFKFFPKLRPLSKYDDFLKNGKDLKLGSIFTLQDQRQIHLMKIIIRADMTCIIKVIGPKEILISLKLILQQY
ncbi:hypothetical protein pb186bvf_003786 [Paramecium bursaria]